MMSAAGPIGQIVLAPYTPAPAAPPPGAAPPVPPTVSPYVPAVSPPPMSGYYENFLRAGQCLWTIIIGWIAGHFTLLVHAASKPSA
jgi:hypothetical protein